MSKSDVKDKLLLYPKRKASPRGPNMNPYHDNGLVHKKILTKIGLSLKIVNVGSPLTNRSNSFNG